MGDAAEDILCGFVCQICGNVIDLEEPGYPRSCSTCEPSRSKRNEVNYSKIEQEVVNNKFAIVETKEINYGRQYRIVGETILNVYKTGRFAVQGVPNKKLKSLMFTIYNNIEKYY